MKSYEVTYTVTTTYKTTVEAANDMEAMDIVEDDEFFGFVITVDKEIEAIYVEENKKTIG